MNDEEHIESSVVLHVKDVEFAGPEESQRKSEVIQTGETALQEGIPTDKELFL